MIRGIVYLAGLVTLGLVALVAAIAYKVHLLPWGRYVESGREFLAETLARPREEAGRDSPHEGRRAEARGASVADGILAMHTVRKGETLYAIAARYYGDGELWPLVARANSIRRPSDLRVGSVVAIPRRPAPSALEGVGDPDACRSGPQARTQPGTPADWMGLALTPALEPEAGQPAHRSPDAGEPGGRR